MGEIYGSAFGTGTTTTNVMTIVTHTTTTATRNASQIPSKIDTTTTITDDLLFRAQDLSHENLFGPQVR